MTEDLQMSNLIQKAEFPRASQYDPDWVLANQMGPNALWLVEWLTSKLKLEPGMRMLDLGCGKAMTSIFLAKEFGVKVWAADLWIGPDNNWKRAQEQGVGDLVCPMRLEAHSLPFAHDFFDAVISVDSYQYFGTDQLYLGYLTTFVKEGGQIGITVPGLMQSIENDPPEHLTSPQQNGKVFWDNECWSFKTADDWRTNWERSGKVTVDTVDTLPDGWKHWRDFEHAVEAAGTWPFPSDAEALEKDEGRFVGFVRAIATRNGEESLDLYNPSVGVEFDVDT
jgi:cyclopropane fatty-acyl-phospholipid synthase-like methyltransferase